MARYLLGFILIAALALVLWWVLQRNEAERQNLLELTSQQDSTVAVTAGTARMLSFRDSFTVNGTFEPWKQAVVVPTLSGQVERLLVSPGTYVRQGQVLLEIDNEYTVNELRAAEITLQQAQKDVTRMQNLVGEGGVTQRQYEEAQAKVESAQVKLESLRKRIQDAELKAPISGYVTPIPRNPLPVEGGFVGQGNPVFMLVDIQRLHLRVLLTAEQIGTIEKGQQVAVRCDALPDTIFTGKVGYIGVTTDFLSKRYPVDIELHNHPTNLIRGGMNGWAAFVGRQPGEQLVIPREAILRTAGEPEVYVLEQGHARRRTVRIGSNRGPYVTVLHGLQAGEQIVLSGQINLTDGSAVSVRERSE